MFFRLRSSHGFTLVELMVVSGLMGVVGLVGYAMLHTGMVLFTQNVALNMSGVRISQAVDRMTEAVRAAEEMPQLITNTGAAATGTTADGILVKRYLGGPYVIKKSDGTTDNIDLSTKIFQVEYATNTGVNDPAVGDYLKLDITSAPELQVAAVQVLTNPLAGTRKLKVTTTTAIGETVSPWAYRVAGYLHRREAYVFIAQSSRRELRYYPKVTTGMSYSTAANYQVLGNGYDRLGSNPYFTRTTVNSMSVIALSANVHYSGESEYVDRVTGFKSFSTLPISTQLWVRKQ